MGVVTEKEKQQPNQKRGGGVGGTTSVQEDLVHPFHVARGFSGAFNCLVVEGLGHAVLDFRDPDDLIERQLDFGQPTAEIISLIRVADGVGVVQQLGVGRSCRSPSRPAPGLVNPVGEDEQADLGVFGYGGIHDPLRSVVRELVAGADPDT